MLCLAFNTCKLHKLNLFAVSEINDDLFLSSDTTDRCFINHPSMIQILFALYHKIMAPASVLISIRITWTIRNVMAPLKIALLSISLSV